MRKAGPLGSRFRDEFRLFARFLARPRLAPRAPGRCAAHSNSWQADWMPVVPWRRLLQWAAFLWFVNMVFLGPIAFMAAGAGGAQHRLDLTNIPWLQAVLWAPVVEELVFRYGLRRPGRALWLLPVATVAMLAGPRWSTAALVAAVVLLCWHIESRPFSLGRAVRQLSWPQRRAYQAWFPWVFHASCLLFAAIHLHNFSLHGTPYWLMPLLVLPQWLTGLALGWMRVRRGIGASMLLHGLFNSGPLLIVWIVLHTVPQLAA